MKKFFATVAAAAVMVATPAMAQFVPPGQGGGVPSEGGGFTPPTVPPEGGTPTITVGGNENNLNQGQEQGQNQGQNQGQDQSQGQNQGQDQSQIANGGNGYGGAGGNGYGGAGGAGGTGGNVGDIVNSFTSRVYSYAGGPALGAAVSNCLAVTGTSGHIGVAGINVGLGGTKATYSERCEMGNLQVALLNFLTLNSNQPEIQAFALRSLMEINPVIFGPAIETVTAGYSAAMARCNGRVGSAFDILGSNTCTTPFAQASAQQNTTVAPNVTVNVDLNTPAAQRQPTATAPRRATTTTPRRAPTATPRRAPATDTCATATAAAARAEAARVRACTVPAPGAPRRN